MFSSFQKFAADFFKNEDLLLKEVLCVGTTRYCVEIQILSAGLEPLRQALNVSPLISSGFGSTFDEGLYSLL